MHVFARLGHNTFVGRNDEKCEIDAACPRNHGIHEIAVPRNVNDANNVAVFERQMRESEINGDSAAFFFLVGVAVDAGKRFYEGGFAMVDVPGSAHDQMFHILFNVNSPSKSQSSRRLHLLVSFLSKLAITFFGCFLIYSKLKEISRRYKLESRKYSSTQADHHRHLRGNQQLLIQRILKTYYHEGRDSFSGW